VGLDDLDQSRIWTCELLIFVCLLIFKVIRAVEIVFRPSAIDGGEIRIAIDVKLNLAFTPPAVVMDAPGQVRSYVLAPALDAVDYRVDLFVRQRIHSAKLGVKVGRIGGYGCKRVVHLVEQGEGFIVEVLDRNLRLPAEWHRPIRIERAAGIYADCHG